MVEPPLVLFTDLDLTMDKTQKHVNHCAWDALWQLQIFGRRRGPNPSAAWAKSHHRVVMFKFQLLAAAVLMLAACHSAVL